VTKQGIRNEQERREVFHWGKQEGPISDLRQPRKIRYTRLEWAAIVDRARACGRPPARYVREASLGTAPRARRGYENDQLIRELGRIGTVLNQLASAARDPGITPNHERLEAALAELLAAVRRLS
jgi:hypothetical protein